MIVRDGRKLKYRFLQLLPILLCIHSNTTDTPEYSFLINTMFRGDFRRDYHPPLYSVIGQGTKKCCDCLSNTHVGGSVREEVGGVEREEAEKEII